MDSIECNGRAADDWKPSKPGKLPLEFAIAHMKLTDVSAGGPMHFDAELTNPRPAGTIVTTGSMGPWMVDDPGETPVAGNYRFEHADLGVFKGIAGILSSTGKYQGVLRDLVVDGQTDTPDFRLTHFGTALPLHTEFHAHVDGTNGDTLAGAGGRDAGAIALYCRGEDCARSGWSAAERHSAARRTRDCAEGECGPGTDGGFSAPDEQERDAAADRRAGAEDHARNSAGTGAGGRAAEAEREFFARRCAVYQRKDSGRRRAVEFARAGRCQRMQSAARERTFARRCRAISRWRAAVITLPDLKYTVPGAEIDLKGTYGVDGGALDFTGTAKTQATVSQLVGGWKGVLLKPADRSFKKDGAGTEVPIHIDGTRENPQFGIDFDRMKHTTPATPGQPRIGRGGFPAYRKK